MKRRMRLIMKRMVLGVTMLLACSWISVMAQTTQTSPAQNPAESARPQVPPPQGDQFADLRPLNLTPDQIQRIRLINMELKDERQAANLKLRLTQRALTEAIESPNPNEALIEQRSREVAEAQANTIRLRSLTEARILQVLTPEQRVRLREMRQRNLALRRERQRQMDSLNQRQPGLQRDPNNPALTPNQRRALRRQQKP